MSRRPEQLLLPLVEPPRLRIVRGEGQGSGHPWGRLVALPASAPGGGEPLPSREEITLALLQAGADLVAGRISVAGATAIREAAEEALRRLEEAQRDPASQPRFVRAAKALSDLCR